MRELAVWLIFVGCGGRCIPLRHTEKKDDNDNENARRRTDLWR